MGAAETALIYLWLTGLINLLNVYLYLNGRYADGSVIPWKLRAIFVPLCAFGAWFNLSILYGCLFQ